MLAWPCEVIILVSSPLVSPLLFKDIPILTHLSRFRTPYLSILIHALIVFGLSFLDFEDLVRLSPSQ